MDFGNTDARLQAYATVEAYALMEAFITATEELDAAWDDHDVSKADCLAAIERADRAADKVVERIRLELTGDERPLPPGNPASPWLTGKPLTSPADVLPPVILEDELPDAAENPRSGGDPVDV